ncbi:MAG: glutamate--cysteine ligase [Alphaproteobacteria bacterium]
MSSLASNNLQPITHLDDLSQWFADGCKPKSEWRIGVEHEKFILRHGDNAPVPYEGPNGIGRLLQGFTRYGWQEISENGKVIALQRGKAAISLEPGGQFELSGAPLADVHAVKAEIEQHFAELAPLLQELGLRYELAGFNPFHTRQQVPWMPKERYSIMKDYMPLTGTHGLDMMLRTATVQANMDYSSEADMVQKMQVSMALQPIITAIFAHSAVVEGQNSGYASFRARCWLDTDPKRAGILPFVFADSFGFERYRDYALDVPMYLVYRKGKIINAAGQSFRDFLQGKLPALPNEKPTLADWATHLGSIFPDVRLKQYLEMRGADCGPMPNLLALPALWTGLLYDDTSLQQAQLFIKDWSSEDIIQLHRVVPQYGINSTFKGQPLTEIITSLLQLATIGLRHRGLGEEIYLAPLQDRTIPFAHPFSLNSKKLVG